MSEEKAQQHKYLSFKLGDEIFAFSITQVKEILDYTKPTRVPHVPEYVLGVTNLRGKAIPLVDLRRLMGIRNEVEGTCIIIFEANVTDEQVVVGGVADSVHEVIELDDAAVDRTPQSQSFINNSYIHGIAETDNGFMIILDIDSIFSSSDIEMLEPQEA